MELAEIEKLLALYFEGATDLKEEEILLNYFNNENVADHLLQYKPIFVGLAAAKKVQSKREFQLPAEKLKVVKSWWYSAAAVVVVAIGVGSLYFSQPQMTQEEKEALAAFEDSKAALLFLSENFNKGAKQLSFVDEFTITKNKIMK
ncbi:MAG TPA: hypothetical protein VKX40_07805 [Aequorivita sp.]|nr:hypothetical protein [Aequorivita sp.]